MASLGAIGQAAPKVGLILPGISVGGVTLDSDASAFKTAVSLWSGSAKLVPSGTIGEGCPDRLYYWNDLNIKTSEINAYLRNGEISQISSFGPKFALSNGLGTGSTEKSVERAYPDGRMYVLLFSANKVNGGRDAYYWVDKDEGIAFELDWWQSKEQRLVGNIDIFHKRSNYQPEGCISTPQQWRELKTTPHLRP